MVTVSSLELPSTSQSPGRKERVTVFLNDGYRPDPKFYGVTIDEFDPTFARFGVRAAHVHDTFDASVS